MGNRFFTTREAADMMGKSIRQVRNWIHDGKIEAEFMLGRWYIVKESFFERLNSDSEGKKRELGNKGKSPR